MPDNKIIRKFSAETKTLEDSRSVIVTISTSSPDRDGDIVVPKGGKLENFLKNPVVLFGHKYNEPPIAKAEDLVVSEDNIKAKVTFPAEGTYAFADTIYELIKAGIMHAWSIGLSIDPDATEQIPGGGMKFNSWELLEFSAVPVPANAEALTIVRAKGLSAAEIKDVIEEKKEEPAAKKDVAEAVALARTIDDLNWLIYMFQYNDVSEETTNRMTEALVILLEVMKSQATIGEKEFEIDKSEEAPALPAIPEASKQDDLIKAAVALRDALRPADKGIGLLLRDLNTLERIADNLRVWRMRA